MAVNWLEVAKKMAEDARAQLAINRKRLREILAERARQQPAQEPHTNAQ
jgi:hypothetical protein